MSFQLEQPIQTSDSHPCGTHWQSVAETEHFYYFAYGSCMCPVDLKRTLRENTYQYVIGAAILKGYRLGFYRRSLRRNCGVLDIIPDANAYLEGVLSKILGLKPCRFTATLC